MGICKYCSKESPVISQKIGYCVDCIRDHLGLIKSRVMKIHLELRAAHGLPPEPPHTPGGIECDYCINQCEIGEGETGYCGFRTNRGGQLENPLGGLLDWYYDPLPTNCVASWVCPGGSRAGYPDYSNTDGPEIGSKNIAVFYRSCTFDCLFCQNWHFKESTGSKVTPQQLADHVDDRTNCICYFGGDPASQITHAISASKQAREKKEMLRICWETNGSVSRPYLRKMLDLSLESGGCIKFDLKAYHEELNLALCGISNKNTLENFAYLAEFVDKRPNPPLLIASTPLIPGYMDDKEIKAIAAFIASLNPNIPYSVLGFYPCYYLDDLPSTSKQHAKHAREIAEGEGLTNVHIGNWNMLGRENY
ncbi:radical SAM protein [bacterium]|nr:radical SAM protein [bacterium]